MLKYLFFYLFHNPTFVCRHGGEVLIAEYLTRNLLTLAFE